MHVQYNKLIQLSVHFNNTLGTDTFEWLDVTLEVGDPGELSLDIINVYNYYTHILHLRT